MDILLKAFDLKMLITNVSGGHCSPVVMTTCLWLGVNIVKLAILSTTYKMCTNGKTILTLYTATYTTYITVTNNNGKGLHLAIISSSSTTAIAPLCLPHRAAPDLVPSMDGGSCAIYESRFL
ncbi:hypothetical protein TNCV_4820801 [Trichonephila clavipes]|nr:hypothetical protein TNCV_4820801 [Trichonephila clavipes]